MKKNNKNYPKINPKVKEVLILLGAGAFLIGSLIMPGLPIVLKPIMDEKRRKDEKEWERYNASRLKILLKRLHEQKVIEIVDGGIKVTEKGKQRVLKYKLEDLELKRVRDGKWRVIVYDVANLKRYQRDLFRETLNRLKLFKLQESVYLTPFVCDQEIEFLRQTFDIGKEVMILKVKEIENEEAYKKYFGL